MSASRLRRAARRSKDLSDDLANRSIAKASEQAARFYKTLLMNYGYIFSTCGRVRL
jgi:hypothetical protein